MIYSLHDKYADLKRLKYKPALHKNVRKRKSIKTSDLALFHVVPNLGLAPLQMWHETLFDELEESAYRCKKERSMAFKIHQNAFLPQTPLGELTMLSEAPVG